MSVCAALFFLLTDQIIAQLIELVLGIGG
jgi:hypothetical protein